MKKKTKRSEQRRCLLTLCGVELARLDRAAGNAYKDGLAFKNAVDEWLDEHETEGGLFDALKLDLNRFAQHAQMVYDRHWMARGADL